MTSRLSRRDLETDAESAARKLLGARLVRILESGERLSGRIVETEAYLGVEDRAAHTYAGRRTARNESMYARAGTAYVYFTYGMHHCVNAVCGREGEPIAVLIRALEPEEGIDTMRAHRSRRVRKRPPTHRDLCRGPGRLCEAMEIDRRLDGHDLIGGGAIWLERGASPERIARSPRIGVASAGEWALRPLRFTEEGSPFVSGPGSARGAGSSGTGRSDR